MNRNLCTWHSDKRKLLQDVFRVLQTLPTRRREEESFRQWSEQIGTLPTASASQV